MSFVKFNFNTLGKNVFLERFLLTLLFFGLILNLFKESFI